VVRGEMDLTTFNIVINLDDNANLKIITYKTTNNETNTIGAYFENFANITDLVAYFENINLLKMIDLVEINEKINFIIYDPINEKEFK